MSAQSRGWGPGWPNCQTHRMVPSRWVTGRFHEDILELVDVLCQATEQRGYKIRKDWSWGFACRSIRGSDQPSNHSWGLAPDINAPNNPMGSTLRTDMPAWMPRMWEACGFRWGGRYKTRPDAMHYEYMGRPSDVARHLRKARTYLNGGTPTSTTTEEDGEVNLREGSKGPHVGRVQIRLMQVYPHSPVEKDDVFGPVTRDWVAKFQKEKNLLGDEPDSSNPGVVDSMTYNELAHAAHGEVLH